MFRNFKDWLYINFENAAQNPWMTDQFLIRFCRARKFDLTKVCEMFSNYMLYRKNNQIDTIMGVSSFSVWDSLAQRNTTLYWLVAYLSKDCSISIHLIDWIQKKGNESINRDELTIFYDVILLSKPTNSLFVFNAAFSNTLLFWLNRKK